MADVRCQGCGTVYHLDPSSGGPRKCDICGKQLETPLAPPSSGPPKKVTPERQSNFYRKPEAPLPSPGAPVQQQTPPPAAQSTPLPVAKPIAPPVTPPPPAAGSGQNAPPAPSAPVDPQAPVPTAMPVAPPVTPPMAPASGSGIDPQDSALDAGDSGIDEVEAAEETPAETTRPARTAPRPSRKNNTWMTCLLLVVLGVVVFSAVGGIVVALRFKQILAMASGDTITTTGGGPIIAVPAGAVQSNWADATESAVRRGDVQVSIVRVEYGEVRAKDNNNAVKITEEKDYMQIYVSLANKGATPVNYVSWYGNTFGPAAATLTSVSGTRYQMNQFTGLRSIRGHTKSATLKPREEISDVLIFQVPRALGGSMTGGFRLSLPAAAYGEEGEFRFEFPGSYVTVIPESTDFGGPLTEDAMADDAMAADAMAEDS